MDDIKRRGMYRYTEPVIRKASAAAEKADFNFPKTAVGIFLAGAAVALKIFAPVVPFTEVLFVMGITTAAAGIGVKIDRVKKGGSAWQNETDLMNKIVKWSKKND